ncbi:MAG TPA: hypothetical protein VFU37_05610 [Pyrinomonadaceae bacterium]|nr:hypothetical protein [Pyrinomonadaceae bacterium]
MRNTIRLAIVFCSVLVIITGITIKLRRASTANASKENRLVVHEWGTFTSIAGKDGVALEWRPLNGSTDLPKFVHTMQDRQGLRHIPGKGEMTALVRMETPVLYFYSNRELDITANVSFPKGKITEWYPQARSVNAGINWGTLKISPGAAFNLPADYSDNHYYAARETDAAPVQVCGTSGKPAEQEKFLFYRGVGSFDLPLAVTFTNNRLTLRNRSNEEIPRLIVFENRNGKIGYRVVDSFSREITSERPELDKNLDALIRELRQTLVAAGLYDKEAEAMIKTWKNSWFEEGMRVFYILPRRITDATLPLQIDPHPAELVRVLVGRTEVITPEMEQSVKQHVSRLNDPSPKTREEARQAIQKLGRFYEPILKRIVEDERDPKLRARIQRLLEVPSSPGE